MDIRVINSPDPARFKGDAIAVGVFEDSQKLEGPAEYVDAALPHLISELLQKGAIHGTLDEIAVIHPRGALDVDHVLVIGLGKVGDYTLDRIRRAAAVAARKLSAIGARKVALSLAWAPFSDGRKINLAAAARCQVEGLTLGLYHFNHYKSSTNHHDQNTVEEVTIYTLGPRPALEPAIEKGRIIAEAENFARDLGNEPANILTPDELARRARLMAEETGLEREVFGPAYMREQGMGALLAVGGGSANEPRLIVLRYHGSDDPDRDLVFVGKGITFDSGGVSIKPAADMDAMKMDMSGGAAVLGAMKAIAALKPNCNVTGIVPAAENMPGRSAYRPGDIVRVCNGTTIEIINTDAEGRLVLADALAWAVKQGHRRIIDLATLTGAIVVSLGNVYGGVFANDEKFRDTIEKAGRQSGERVWPMPFDAEYDSLIHSDIADVKQTGGRAGGAIIAAKVLGSFVGDARWAHIDIAGVNSRAHGTPYAERGATGFGVRLLAQLVCESQLLDDALQAHERASGRR